MQIVDVLKIFLRYDLSENFVILKDSKVDWYINNENGSLLIEEIPKYMDVYIQTKVPYFNS